MSFTLKDATDQVASFFNETYTITSGQVIPTIADLPLGNSGREIELCVLFIDIRESTRIVKALKRETCAKMYKSFLWGISKIAREHGGETKSFNGDGVLIIFHGVNKEVHAVKAAMEMSFYIMHVLKPKIQSYIDKSTKLSDLDFDFGIGIDTGTVLVVRGGMKGEGNNDLVWAGNATNQAVKLSAFSKEKHDGTSKPKIFISENVYTSLSDSLKNNRSNIGIPIVTPIWKKQFTGLLTLNSFTYYHTTYYIKLT